jgi:hypothetical protein
MKDPFRRIEDHVEQHRAVRKRSAPEHPICDLADLRAHLETALAVEHATLPPYLTALYTIQGEANGEAARAVRSVAMEEMLHMVLVANVLVALGGKPSLTKPHFVPRYPSRLPHAGEGLNLGLQKFSRECILKFMRVEQPEMPHARAEGDDFHTIGQFYRAIEEALTNPAIAAEIEKFWVAHPPERSLARQIGADEFFGSGGSAMLVTSFATAKKALDEIMDQGEGFVLADRPDQVGDGDAAIPGGKWEPAHYFRFQQLILGRAYRQGDDPENPSGPMLMVDWNAASNIRPNARLADFRRVNSIAVPKMEAFNRAYHEMLAGIEARFRGETAKFGLAIARMLKLRDLARELMNLPSGFDDGTMAAPSFERIDA